VQLGVMDLLEVEVEEFLSMFSAGVMNQKSSVMVILRFLFEANLYMKTVLFPHQKEELCA
jgi:hypothetical protein